MTRLRQAQCEAIATAMNLMPRRLRPLVECDVFCGDPLFAGVHGFETLDDGRSYRRTAHACFPYDTTDGRLTVVLPHAIDVYTAVHELGHVLHWNLQQLLGGWDCLPRLVAVTEYATTNVAEEFAEAFTAWFYPARQVDESPCWLRWSLSNNEFFDRLAVGW